MFYGPFRLKHAMEFGRVDRKAAVVGAGRGKPAR